MNEVVFQEIALEVGAMRVYDINGIKLHAYQTNDPIADEVFIVEKNGRGFVIEYPCFFNNIKELEAYLTSQNITIEGIVASYHMAGATFLANTPVYATAQANEYGHAGGGAALVNNFAQAFGEAFDSSLPEVSHIIEGDTLTLAGIEMNIVRNDEAFDIEIPAINATYIHMLGHDCHSIVGGAEHADAMIEQLQGILDKGFDLVLTSHYTPEDLKDVRTKIAYVEELKAIAATSTNAEAFKSSVQEKYPDYAGDNYLDMTTGAFFGA